MSKELNELKKLFGAWEVSSVYDLNTYAHHRQSLTFKQIKNELQTLFKLF